MVHFYRHVWTLAPEAISRRWPRLLRFCDCSSGADGESGERDLIVGVAGFHGNGLECLCPPMAPVHFVEMVVGAVQLAMK
jgi:hypothetical protein